MLPLVDRDTPANKAMMPLKHAIDSLVREVRFLSGFCSLVMCVTNPWEGTSNGDSNHEIGDNTHDQYRVMVIFVIDKDGNKLEDQPAASGSYIREYVRILSQELNSSNIHSATGMDASQVLEC
jgi:hypothetical protein